MLQTVTKNPTQSGSVRLHGSPRTRRVSGQLVIPAVPGEFYSYASKFTPERPLYALMKCKANKDCPLTVAPELGDEANLVFLFDSAVQVCPIKTACIAGILGDSIDDGLFGETWVAPAGIAIKKFRRIHSQKDEEALVEVCRTACSSPETTVTLKPDAVVAVMTDAGKHGLFVAKNVTPSLIEIDACHILL